jgi:hypothetical protein
MVKLKLIRLKPRYRVQKPHQWLKAITLQVLLLSGLLQAGCHRIDADSLFSDYQQRLHRVLQLPEATAKDEDITPLPPIRQLLQPIPESKLNLIDLVALRHCNLQQLIAERNNSLGKVMTSANQLGYELQLLFAIKPCLQHPQLDTKLQTELQHIFRQKQQQLPIVMQNFLTTDITLRKQLSGQPRLLTLGAAAAITEPLTALKNLNLLKQQVLAEQLVMDGGIDAQFINQQLGVLYGGNFIADWQYTLRQSNGWLTTINKQLSKIQPRNICPQQTGNSKTEILNNILTQIFIPRVQSYLAEVDRISYQLVPEMTALYQGTALDVIVEARMTKPAEQLRVLLKQHVAWYQQVQQECHVTPPRPAASRVEND